MTQAFRCQYALENKAGIPASDAWRWHTVPPVYRHPTPQGSLHKAGIPASDVLRVNMINVIISDLPERQLVCLFLTVSHIPVDLAFRPSTALLLTPLARLFPSDCHLHRTPPLLRQLSRHNIYSSITKKYLDKQQTKWAHIYFYIKIKQKLFVFINWAENENLKLLHNKQLILKQVSQSRGFQNLIQTVKNIRCK